MQPCPVELPMSLGGIGSVLVSVCSDGSDAH